MAQPGVLHPRRITFQVGELRVGTFRFQAVVRGVRSLDSQPGETAFDFPSQTFPEGTDVVQFPSHPVESRLPRLTLFPHAIRYVPHQYRRYSIDLTGEFSAYLRKFSSKSRFTLKKKLRRFQEHCGGTIRWRTYRDPSEIDEFYELARGVSEKTYQERLLHAGLPATEDYRKELHRLAENDAFRGYILWDGARPIAYLCCPIIGDVVSYSYVGFDPDNREWSPGVVLFVLALEQLFAERRFVAFDFTEGESPLKEFFANQFTECADIYFFRRNLRYLLVLLGHSGLFGVSRTVGWALERLGLKSRVRVLVRTRRLWDRSPKREDKLSGFYQTVAN